MVWPAGWRLPSAGESVQIERDFGGFVEFVEWCPNEGVVKVRLR